MSNPKPLADDNIIYWRGCDRERAQRIAAHVKAITAMPEYQAILAMVRAGPALDMVLDTGMQPHADSGNT